MIEVLDKTTLVKCLCGWDKDGLSDCFASFMCDK